MRINADNNARAQAPTAVRSQKMEDVIFAGTASRPALGRAEVSLTLDNGSGRLDLDLPEVTITRRLYRDGTSEYEINGTQCRLLDIQELLSDSGVGRHQHVLIGQGRVDGVLNALAVDCVHDVVAFGRDNFRSLPRNQEAMPSGGSTSTACRRRWPPTR